MPRPQPPRLDEVWEPEAYAAALEALRQLYRERGFLDVRLSPPTVEIAEADRTLHALPLYHCAQLDVFFGPAIYIGSSNVITGKPTPDHLLALLEQHRITSFFAPPTVWIALLRSPLFDAGKLAHLSKGYYGASIMPVEVLRELAVPAPEHPQFRVDDEARRAGRPLVDREDHGP